MTTNSTVINVSSFSTDAKFRTWGSAVSAAILAAGLTQTADTGQINWTTVTKPTAINTKAGYEIWRFNDSLQATKPLFFRLDYGSNGTASGNSPGTWLTVGTGTDGAGTITGVGMVVQQGTSGSVTPTNTACLVGAAYSTASGSCTILAGISLAGAGSHGGLWLITRTCNSTTGVPTGDGVGVINITSSSSPTSASAQYTTPTNYAVASSIPCTPVQLTSYLGGTTAYVNKAYALIPDPYPVNGYVSYLSADISTMSTFAASIWGTSFTYLALGSTFSTSFTAVQSGSFSAAVFWE